MAITMKKAMENARNTYITKITQLLEGEDIGMTASNEFNFPVVLENGEEAFIVVKVSLPTGSRGGDAYDGYEVRAEYAQHCKEQAEKKAKEAEAKKAKLAKQAEQKAKLAASKAKAQSKAPTDAE